LIEISTTAFFNEEEKAPIVVNKFSLNLKATVGDCLLNYEIFKTELGDWQDPLKDYLAKKTFRETYEFVKKEYESNVIYPPKELIFNAFK